MKSKFKNFTVLILISLLLIGADRLSWLYWPKKRFEAVFNPLQKGIYEFSQNISDWRDFIGVSSKQKLILLENKKVALEEKVAVLEKENKKLQEVNQEQEYLLQVPTDPKWNFLPAQVLRTGNSQMLINKGNEHKLKEKMVLIKGNPDLDKAILVGRISKVNPLSSIVALPNNPNHQIAVELLNGGEGLIKGRTNGEIELFNVLQEVELNQNELIITSGGEEKYPQGLVIGRVENIIKQESEVYQRAVIEPIIKYSEIKDVFVVMVEEFN